MLIEIFECFLKKFPRAPYDNVAKSPCYSMLRMLTWLTVNFHQPSELYQADALHQTTRHRVH